MGINNLIFNRAILEYKENYLKENSGYPKLLPVNLICKIPITKENSSLVNPHTGSILGPALKSCITTETMNKLKRVDPVNKSTLQIVLLGSELYINPLFRFKCRENYLACDVVFLGRISKQNREIVKNIVEVLGKKITNKPHYDSIVVTDKLITGKKAEECIKYKNLVYSFNSFIAMWEITSLGMYL